MRIHNRIKYMIAVENRYYNRGGALSFLTGVSFALLTFALAFSVFYYYGDEQTDSNLRFLRYSIYILAAYLLVFIAYRFAIRYLGIRYPLVTGFTALTFLADAGMAYLLFRAAFCWNLNRLIENPLGFEPILRRSFNTATVVALYFTLFLIVSTFIPIKRITPKFFGRFFVFNVISPLLTVPILIAVVAFIPESVRVEYTRQISVLFFSLMLCLSIRYFYKTILYYVLLFDKGKVALEDVKQPKAEKQPVEREELPKNTVDPLADRQAQAEKPMALDNAGAANQREESLRANFSNREGERNPGDGEDSCSIHSQKSDVSSAKKSDALTVKSKETIIKTRLPRLKRRVSPKERSPKESDNELKPDENTNEESEAPAVRPKASEEDPSSKNADSGQTVDSAAT